MTTALDGKDYHGKVIARAGPYVATRRTGDRHCEIRVTHSNWEHPNAGRLIGVAHDVAAARVMVRDLVAGR